ncbi:CHC2 zinc finger domain-containing protein [Brevundimonas sp. TWP2-3-4b1]|uniref:CHC2 zinc finger domain-containing protein n=1 Tax=Brevundimonas sp. TWP2-3-4b1 TaxID=2804580 RepID=UPI003CF60C66
MLDAVIERLRSDVSLVRLVEACGINLTMRDGDYVGRCPFHNDSGSSLVVGPSTNLWRCEGECAVEGDVIAWVIRREGVSHRHAVALLRDGYEPVAGVAPVAKATTAKLPVLRAVGGDAALLRDVMGHYHSTLKESPEALAYLEKRGLTHPDLIEAFNLGYSDRSLGYRLPQANRKAGAEMRGRLQALGVLRDSGHEHLRGSLVIPILDAHGAIADLYGRKVGDGLRKGTPDHVYLPGPRRGVFNLAAVRSSDEVILAGSLIDAMTFWCAGYRHVSAAYGPDGFTHELLNALSEHGVKRVLIAFGRTAEGATGAQAVADQVAGRGMSAFRVNFPKGMDANAYALSVTPAPKSLGVLLRAAEWMAGAEPERRAIGGLSDLDAAPAPVTVVAPPAPVSNPVVIVDEPDDDDPPPPSDASPVPVGPSPDVLAKPQMIARGKGHDVVIVLGDRTWRARGLERNSAFESLKINLMVRRGDAFHVDGLDLLSAKSRTAFVAEAALELSLPTDAIKRDLGLVLLKLEAVQDERLDASIVKNDGAVVISAADESAALTLLKAPDLLDRIAADVAACGVVGEAENAVCVYLAALSRKLDRPLAVLIQSTSAAGKSALMDAVLELVPEEERVAYSAMTGQSLFYLGETDLKHKVLSIAEEEGARHAAYALKLLQSQGTLTIASTGKDPTTGKLVTQDYVVEGPVALMLTTTAIDLDEELKNRCLVLTIDESREQTRAIHIRQRFEETLEGLSTQTTRAAILALHRNAQRLLKPLRVVNPYAERLTFLDDQTRTRRDHRKYLALIRTVALLRQHQRPVRQLIRPGAEPVAYIEATLEDIADANRLAHAVLGTTLDDLPPQTRRLLGLVHGMVEDRAKATALESREVRFTRREVREAIGWGDTQLKVHLSRLLDLEYLFLRRQRDGDHAGRFVYELAWAGEGSDGSRFLMGLIDPVAIVSADDAGADAHETYDEDRSGLAGAQSGVSRALDGGVAGGGHVGDGTTPTGSDRAVADADTPWLEAARSGPPEAPTVIGISTGMIG